MAASQVEMESLYVSIGILGISGGSLLLLVNDYAGAAQTNPVPSTALGVLLLVIAALLAYTGVRHSLSQTPLYVCLSLTISAFWWGLGIVNILVGEGLTESRTSMVPGLAAFTLALLVIGVVGLLQKEVVLSVFAFAISLACAHQIAGLCDPAFGRGATAASYLLVAFLGAYFGSGRLLSCITSGVVRLPGTAVEKRTGAAGAAQAQMLNDVAPVGLIMNLLAAGVLACHLLGVVLQLPAGLVPWLWTAGVFQLGVCILSYRAMDTLTATFYGFTSILRFAEGYSLLLGLYGYEPYSPVPFPVIFAVLFSVLFVFSLQKSVADGLYRLLFAAYCISVAAQPRGFFQGGTQGVQAAIFVASAAMLLVTLHNMVSPRKVPTGDGLLKTLLTRSSWLVLRSSDEGLHAPYLGFSKYADADILGHACSTLATFAVTATGGAGGPLAVLILPWAVVPGGILQLLCGAVAFSRGKTLESTAFTLYGVMWTVWGLTRYAGLYGTTRSFNLAVGIICFMLFNGFVTAGALFLNKAWVVSSLVFQLILISFLLDAVGALPYGYDIGVTVIFGLVSFYCFLASLFNSSFQKPQLPLGDPFIKLPGFGGGRDSCPHVSARKATSIQQIADIMKNGGICGMPTDTVYVLVAACNRPDAVLKAYKTKVQAEDRPMSLWISNIKQLTPAKHLISPVLWDFMEAAWPSSISMVIPRGPWMDHFGLGDSAKYIGTPQSIALRNPDCTVATHLMDLVGPIAVTSANPTGEADTTHHNQVYAKLGDKVDGVLCDGPSPENIASTVVDCTKIENGQIGFFRVGVIPKSKVLQIFEEVQRKHKLGQVNLSFEADATERRQEEKDEAETARDRETAATESREEEKDEAETARDKEAATPTNNEANSQTELNSISEEEDSL